MVPTAEPGSLSSRPRATVVPVLLQWAGLEQKKLPKACMPEVKLTEFVTLVELSELYTGSLVRLPIIKGSQKQGDAPLPAVVTIERGT